MDDILDSPPSGENDQPVSEAPDGEKKDDSTDSERRVVSRRPAKRTRSASKKPKRTTRRRTTPVEEKREKPEADAPEDAGQSTEKTAEVPEKRVVSRRPAKRAQGSTTPTKRTTRVQAEDTQLNQSEKEAEITVEAAEPAEAVATPPEPAEAVATPPEPAEAVATPPEPEEAVATPPEPANTRESAAEPSSETTEAAATSPPDAAAGAPVETPAETTQESPTRGASQEHRRTRRRRQPRRQNESGGTAESRERAERIPQSVVEILTDTWTDEKARKYLSEGFLATLSTPLVSRDKVEEIDEEALRDRLKVVRRVLADECMVEDDASDVILLDMVMNALADRLEVYRLTAKDASPETLVQIVQLRYNADRRLIDTVTALKNA